MVLGLTALARAPRRPSNAGADYDQAMRLLSGPWARNARAPLLTRHVGARASIARAVTALLVAVTLAAVAVGRPAAALASANPSEMLTYMPTELVHSLQTPAQVNRYLADLASYHIGQALFQMPRFSKNGKMKLPATNAQMLTLWASCAALYETENGSGISVTAVFNAALGRKGPNLELAATRANMLAAVRSALALGISGVQLDVEPFPETRGFTLLLEELDAMLVAEGFGGTLSVVAPADTATWKPAYLLRVSQLVDQVDPTFYESELPSAAGYEEWVSEGLAYYSANAAPGASIIPVIPSYRANAWHSPVIENIATGTTGIEEALAAADRVNGAGIWWWFGFFENEDGKYKERYAAADRAVWQGRTVDVGFSP